MTLPTAPTTVFLSPEANSGGKDWSNAWNTIQTNINNVLAGIAQTNTLVNTINQQRLYYVDGTVPAGNTIGNSGLLKTFTSQAQFPPNYLHVGNVIRMTFGGVIGTMAGTQNASCNIQFGGVNLIATVSLSINGGYTSAGWNVNCEIIIAPAQATGAGYVFNINSQFMYGDQIKSIVRTGFPLGINLAQTNNLTVQWQWGTADPANTLTMRQMIVEVL